jgi:hypothetical protein
MDDPTLDARIAELEGVARGMTRAQIEAFGPATKGAGKLPTWQSDFPFWFQGTANARMTKAESQALERLWERMLVGLAFAVTGEDVDQPPQPAAAGASMWQRLKRWDQGAAKPDARASAILEREMGGDVWLATVGIWNAFCARLLAKRLDLQLRTDLEAPWRSVMGLDPPQAESFAEVIEARDGSIGS